MSYARGVSAVSLALIAAGCSANRSALPPAGAVPSGARAGEFTALSSQPPTLMQMAWLMTDGSVLTQSSLYPQAFYRYSPDGHGSYADGRWSKVGTLPAGYAPSDFASDLLADGRFVIIGGEYNAGGKYQLQLTNLGAVYDPVATTWTPLGHPRGWRWIGDSPSSVLPDGRLLLGDKLHKWDA